MSNLQSLQEDYVYPLNKRIDIELSYGATKIQFKVFHVTRMGRRTLAFFNDLSLKRIFQTQDVSFVYLTR